MIHLKTKEEIEIMRRAGSVVAGALDMVGRELKPGMTTAQLDALIASISIQP